MPVTSQPGIDLYIAYFPTQKTGDTIHSPEQLSPGRRMGADCTEKSSRSPAVTELHSRRISTWWPRRENEQLVLYWYLAHDRVVTSEYWAKYYLVADSIRLNRSDGALIRLTTPMFRGESPDAAQARILGLGSHIIPILNHYIPR